jgi:hypothetical protein
MIRKVYNRRMLSMLLSAAYQSCTHLASLLLRRFSKHCAAKSCTDDKKVIFHNSKPIHMH